MTTVGNASPQRQQVHAYYHLIPAVQLRFYVKFDALPRQEKVTMREEAVIRASAMGCPDFGPDTLAARNDALENGGYLPQPKR